ncbi:MULTISPECIES: hypothetical protein [Cyanophyceae]|uniref:hypothetical protein n=2 Tax=Cyanophyceae TaxID=3028117 RepID=UPI00016DCD5C|nr:MULTISPECIES: hypothetical protein [Cyanophyceae]ACB00777.1 conserved hypothetical protein [Picosynechococcus sp. PCC 7002]SMH51929.1 hypothetical protein SAMN06272755_2425 [Picosynechococcus sp. OG1]SMQ82213.1 hypothetical protein SAMN06272774_1699 [Synechococcus sp. 7002]
MLTMPTANTQWSLQEKTIAKEAFELSYRREIAAVMAEAKRQATLAADPADLWQLNDFLSARRHYLDGKYDFSPESLVFTFAQLIKEGWLELQELDGLAAEKLSKIRILTLM